MDIPGAGVPRAGASGRHPGSAPFPRPKGGPLWLIPGTQAPPRSPRIRSARRAGPRAWRDYPLREVGPGGTRDWDTPGPGDPRAGASDRHPGSAPFPRPKGRPLWLIPGTPAPPQPPPDPECPKGGSSCGSGLSSTGSRFPGDEGFGYPRSRGPQSRSLRQASRKCPVPKTQGGTLIADPGYPGPAPAPPGSGVPDGRVLVRGGTILYGKSVPGERGIWISPEPGTPEQEPPAGIPEVPRSQDPRGDPYR